MEWIFLSNVIVFIFVLEWSQSLYHLHIHDCSIHTQYLRVFMILGAREYHQMARVNRNMIHKLFSAVGDPEM